MLLVVTGLSVKRFLILWAFMELGTVLFLAFSILENFRAAKRIFGFFLVQAFRGLVLFFLFFLGYRVRVKVILPEIMFYVVLVKMGVPPIHTWAIGFIASLDWVSFYLFNTLQKVIPLVLLNLVWSYMIVRITVVVCGLSSFFYAINEIRIKFLLFFSSTVNFTWLVAVLDDLVVVLVFFSIYAVILYFLVGAFMAKRLESRNLNVRGVRVSHRGKVECLLFLVRVSGLPPIGFFFLKLMIL